MIVFRANLHYASKLTFCWHHGKILHNDGKCVGLNNPGPKFRTAFPQKNLGAKTYKIWRDFGRLLTLTTNISGMKKAIQNQTSTCT